MKQIFNDPLERVRQMKQRVEIAFLQKMNYINRRKLRSIKIHNKLKQNDYILHNWQQKCMNNTQIHKDVIFIYINT